MSALGLNSTKNYPSVNILPAQRSILLADSKYRTKTRVLDSGSNVSQIEIEGDSPYNFQVKFSSALVGKQIIYQKLYWNQPIYSHNNTSAELRFQINGDESTTYVVYALPFALYNQYDGNPPGIPWPSPKVNSYASMMELGFNGDVRLLSSNLQLSVPPPPNTDYGYLYDADGFKMTVYFRYSPAQGFAISFAPSINPNIPVYTIRLLPCSYIENAHFVHGFGIFDPSSGSNQFVPRNQWTVSYFSDDTPNLLPFRYITIRSPELTKDRRMISFQNANANRFGNEIAIIALSPVYTGSYHTENIGDDATVISKRDDYQPQIARISIADENGVIIECDSPISNLLQTPDIVNDSVKNSFLFGPFAGRGNAIFINALIFGVRNGLFPPIASMPIPVQIAQSTLPTPNGCLGYNWDGISMDIPPIVASQTKTNFFSWNTPFPNFPGLCIPIIVTPSGVASFPSIPDSYTYAGLNMNISSQYPFKLFNYTSMNPNAPQVSVFSWDPVKNTAPGIKIDGRLQWDGVDAGFPIAPFTKMYTFIVAYSNTLNDWILATNWDENTNTFSYLSPGFVDFFSNSGPIWRLYTNPKYPNLTEVQNISFYWFATSAASQGSNQFHGHWEVNFDNVIGPDVPMVKFYNTNLLNVQTEYIPPASNVDGDTSYEFGNPQALAKCEELIHELVMVLDKN